MQLTERGLQNVQALSARGMRRASEALTALLGHPVQLDVSSVQTLPPRRVLDLMAGANTGGMAGLQCQISGEMAGDMLFLFPQATVFRMLQALLGRPAEPRLLSGEETSALQEVANVLASSFLSELGDRLGRRVLHSTPLLRLGSVADVLEPMQQDVSRRGVEVLVIQAGFADPDRAIEGRFFVLPELLSLQAVVEGHREAEEATA